MKIVVLIKPTRDLASAEEWVIGSLDHYALSQAIELRDNSGGSVHVLLAGPAEGAKVAQRALASGADESTHIVIDDPDALDALNLAKLIRENLDAIDFDVIVAGQTSDDIETGLVGPMLAELLNLPHVSTVTRIEEAGDRLRLERDIIGGKQVLLVSLPAVVVVLSGRDIPLRYPTPRGMIMARKKPARTVVQDHAKATGGISWSKPALPERSGDGEIIAGLAAREAAVRIATWLRDRGLTG